MKGIQKIRTPVYSPHANPVERFHRTMNQALRTWIGGTQDKSWDIILPNIVLAYNNFIHSATKYSPSRLFFGREIAPPDIPIIPDEHPALTKYDYLEAIKKGQHIACLIARMNQRKMDKLQKPQQPKKAETDPEKYEVGDLIQVRNMGPSDKLSSHWEKVFVITRVASNAIRCVRWRIDLHPSYKLRQEPKDMGQIEERLVHPKDVKKWNSDLPPRDEKLVETLLQSCEAPYQTDSESRSVVSVDDLSVGGASAPPPAPPSPPRPATPPVPPGYPTPPEPRQPARPEPSPPVPRPTPPIDDARFRFPPHETTSMETIPDDVITLDTDDNLVDHYQLAGQAT